MEWLLAALIVIMTTGGGAGKHPDPNVYVPPYPPYPYYYYHTEFCTFTEGSLHVEMRTPQGSTMRTNFSFVGRKRKDVIYEVERAYRWWAAQAGKYGADYFVQQARHQNVYIELGYVVPGDPIPPIKNIKIYRHCI